MSALDDMVHMALQRRLAAQEAELFRRDGAPHQWFYTHAEALAQFRVQAQRQREMERQFWEASEAHNAAADRAIELLRSMLSPDQRSNLDGSDYFYVVGNVTKDVYRIVAAYGRVHRMKPYQGYCVYPGHTQLPGPDVALALKLTIECDEPSFLKKANPVPW